MEALEAVKLNLHCIAKEGVEGTFVKKVGKSKIEMDGQAAVDEVVLVTSVEIHHVESHDAMGAIEKYKWVEALKGLVLRKVS